MATSVFTVDANATTVASKGTPDYTGVSLHTSAQAIPIPIMWGTRRISPNCIWQSSIDTTGNQPATVAARLTTPVDGGNGYSDTFSTLPLHFSPQVPAVNPMGPFCGRIEIEGTVGHALVGNSYGNGDPHNSASIWWVPMILALCEGPINAITRIWNPGGSPAINFDLSVYNINLTPPSLFYTVFTGTTSQTAWGYFPAAQAQAGGPYYVGQDLAYRNTAYIASAVVNTGHNRQTPQQSFEVQRTPNVAYRKPDSYNIGFDYRFGVDL
jgi:hypothetical protein